MTHVVDVCGTLVRDDTTVGLLSNHFASSQRRPWRVVVLRLLTAHSSPMRWMFVALEKATRRHWLKKVLVSLLAGDPASELDASAAAYALVLLRDRRIGPVWARIPSASRPEQVILASASLEPVVKALAIEMGAQYVASTLEVRGGLLTGRYLNDLAGRKEEAIENKFGTVLKNQPFVVISDNLSDRSLMAKASSACVVLHKEAHRARWMNLPAEYIRVTN